MTRRRCPARTSRLHRRPLRLEALESRRVLASFLVTTSNDVVDANDSVTSLREAVTSANQFAGSDTISFDATALDSSSRIELQLGQLEITDSVSIAGPGQHLLKIDAQNLSRLINFNAASGNLSLSGLTLTGGRTTEGDIGSLSSGGAIRFASSGTLTLDNVAVTNNRTLGNGARGGAIFADAGNIVLTDSVISSNQTSGIGSSGGGIYAGSGTVSLLNSILSGNTTTNNNAMGGGIHAAGGAVALIQSTISNNQTSGDSADGGAVFATSGLTIDASRVIANMTAGSDSDGGAVFASGTLDVSNSDVFGNRSEGPDSSGGAVAFDTGIVTVLNSSIAGNQTTAQRSYGAGLFSVRSDITITQSTISDNNAGGAASHGGGISAFFSSLEIVASTVTGNASGGSGGGIAFAESQGDTLEIRNSIIAENADTGAGPDFTAPLSPTSLAVESSLIGNNTGTTLDEAQTPDQDGNIVGDPTGLGIIDPLLGPLMLAGATRVHPLTPSSLAVNSGDNSFVGSIANDQRGAPFQRISGASVDIGAYELQPVTANSFIVTILTDDVDFSDADVSLREALVVANGNPGPETITFAPGLFTNASSIELQLGELVITETVSIQGPGPHALAIDAGGNSRVFSVRGSDTDVTITRATIRGGMTMAADEGGAAIEFLSDGILTLQDMFLTSNHTLGDNSNGGAIYSRVGGVEVERSVISGNSTSGDLASGGAIFAGAGLIATDTTIKGNSTAGDLAPGGGVFSNLTGRNAVALTRTTVSGNMASGVDSGGGGIATGAGAASLVNSTVSGNSASGNGGGVLVADATANHRIVSSTIALNTADGKGGGISAVAATSGSLTIHNSVVASNLDDGSAPDVDASSVFAESSLFGDNTGTPLPEAQSADAFGNLVGAPSPGGGLIDPMIEILAPRGGFTETHALSPSSAAIDAGDPLLLGQLSTDQRGEPFQRVAGGRPDIGSYEVQSIDDVLLVTTEIDELDFSNAQMSLREALQLSSGSQGIETIRFDSAVFTPTTTTDLRLGPLSILDSVAIVGPGMGNLTLNAGGNSRIFEISSALSSVVIEGMTLDGGRTDGDNAVSELTHNGGSIRIEAGTNVTLRDIKIQNSRTSGLRAGGGAIFAADATLSIENSVITDNFTEGFAADGGAIGVRGGTLQISDSTISANRTDGSASGGGIAAVSSQLGAVEVTISRSTIANNEVSSNASLGGGIVMTGGTLSIDDTLIRDNVSSGSMSQGIGIFFSEGSISISNSRIESNRSSGDASIGGGLLVSDSVLELINSSVTENQLEGNDSHGAGMHVSEVNARIVNTTVATNTALGTDSFGGGIAAGPNADLRIVNSTLTGNSVGQSGGGIAVLGASGNILTIHNSILAGNIGTANAPDLLQGTASATLSSSLLGDNAGTLFSEAQTSDAMGNLVGSSAGSGIIDPMLSPLAINGGTTKTQKPLGGSPALDAGNDALAVDAANMPLVSDQRGAPFLRFFNAVDMGAFEVQPPREPVLSWPEPANIFVGTPLTNVQLNATTNTPGSFVYTPTAGTILGLGNDQPLSVDFTPDDTIHYASTSAVTTIDVVSRSDLGDAPDSYATLRSSDGPRHIVGALKLGTLVDAEVDGQPSSDARGDGADDDGITFLTDLVTTDLDNTTASILVNTSARAKLDAWIDFNANGIFDPLTEHLGVGTSIDLFSGDNVVSFTIPAGATAGATFARFRLSSGGGLLPGGAASDGEVEDYAVTILNGPQVVDVMLPRGNVTLSNDMGNLVIQRSADTLFRAPASTVERFEIVGDEFSKVLTIDNTQGIAVPANGIFYDGVDRINTIRLVGSHDTFDLSRSGIIELRNIAAINLADGTATVLRFDSRAVRAMDPRGGGVVVVGSVNDSIEIADGNLWRMSEPIDVAGESFSVVSLSDTFVQADFVSPWQNLAQASDINNDGGVTANDALRIINELARRTFSDPTTGLLKDPSDVSPWPGNYYDQSGDGFATALDALRVINQLARIATAPSGAGEAVVRRPGNQMKAVATTPTYQTDQVEMPGTNRASSSSGIDIIAAARSESFFLSVTSQETDETPQQQAAAVDDLLSSAEFLEELR